MPSSLTCWIVVEDHLTGTKNQCLGVAEALGVTPIIKNVALRQPWKTLSPWLGFEQSYTFSAPLEAPFPDLVIAAGRKSVAASRYIKKASGGKTFTVQLQNPKASSGQFDLVAAPLHDDVKGNNVLHTDGAPNRITPALLMAAKEEFAKQFSSLPSPRVAVMIGGNSKTHTLTSERTHKLVEELNALDASLMITASRRTGVENETILRKGLKKDYIYFWDGTGANPYMGMLAWADFILVTEDSVSMLSDAGTTGKPTYWIDMDGGSPRFTRFRNHLENKGVIRPFSGNLESWNYEPLADAKHIADAICARIKL
jgi:mitochondrial fission protein ELM1